MLRCALLMHLRQETCRGLSSCSGTRLSAQRFARVDTARLSGKSALQETVSAIAGATREWINRRLLETARAAGIETGERSAWTAR